VALEVMPVAAHLPPAIRYPVISAALTDPVAGNPNVRTLAPLPIARRPDVAHTRCGNDLDARLRGRHVNIDTHSTGGQAAGGGDVQAGDKYG